jgi:hypothetical protein
MREIGKWAIGLVVGGAVMVAPTAAPAVSFEDLVPGEMLSDSQVDPYFGRGTEGIEGGVNNNTGEIVQNNVDDFVANVDATAGAEQGFVNVFQVSGDNAEVNVFILIDVNINGIEYGATVVGSEVTGGAAEVLTVSGNASDLTASADIQTVFETSSFGTGP